MERRDGLIPLYLDERQGKLFLEIPGDSLRVLAFFLGSTGLGSNPIGIDRGANGPDHVARFDRNGDRVLVVFENWNYRGASQSEAGLAKTVAESFPSSTVAALRQAPHARGRHHRGARSSRDGRVQDRRAAPTVARAVGYGQHRTARAFASLAGDFVRWIERRQLPAPSPALRPPPGDPFGEDVPW